MSEYTFVDSLNKLAEPLQKRILELVTVAKSSRMDHLTDKVEFKII